MLFSTFKNLSYGLGFIGYLICSNTGLVQAEPCHPTDPLGLNSGNFCPSQPSGLTSESFQPGLGRPYRALPTVQNPAGTILVRPKGFWTGIETSGSSRVIRESSGNSYQLSK